MRTTLKTALLLTVLLPLVANVGARTGEAPPAPSGSEAAAEAASSFGLDLYRAVADQGGNLAVSPLSVSACLGMALAGARGATADEIAGVLHLDPQSAGVHEEFGRLIADLDSIGKSGRCSLSIADGVWIQRGFPVLPGFAGMVEKHYHAHLGAADFVRDRAAARREINLWVRERTAEALPDLLAADVLDDLTRLVLVNAVYFKGRWADRFDPAETRPEAFTLADGTRVEVPMMHHRGRFAYAELPGLKILRLPYEEPRLCMIILLPDAGGGTGAVEGQLTTAALQSWLKLARLHAVEVWLPRFGVCYTARLDSALQQLGMVRAFDEGVADFTGISSAELLFVQHVVHGAMVKVDEEGTEAAAVTGVAVGCGVPEQLPEAEFRADRPFLFVIADVQVSTLLFVGRIARPTP